VADLDELLREFPGASGEAVRAAWAKVPEPAREAARRVLRDLPADAARWRTLLAQAREHLDLAMGKKSRIAIVGPANVGKSSLYNQLVEDKKARAEVSPVPGTTRKNQEADAGVFRVVDTPGADAVGEVGEVERAEALLAAREADLVVAVFDAIQGVKRTEQDLFRDLASLGKPLVVALNKIDLVPAHRPRVVEHAASALGVPADSVLAVSATTGEGVDRLLLAIAKAEPGIVAALGAALPAYRSRLAWAATQKAAATAGAIALTPLPVLDVIPLLAVQSTLVIGISRIYGRKMTFGRARELLATFGLGFLGRTLFQELSKLGGPPGWLLAAAIASATTVVIGYGTARWFETGEHLGAAGARRLAREVARKLGEALRDLGRRRPGRKKVRERLSEALESAAVVDQASGTVGEAGSKAPAAGASRS
jgi:small GTP-binding protein